MTDLQVGLSGNVCILACTDRVGAVSAKIAQHYHTVLTADGVASEVVSLALLPKDLLTVGLYHTQGKNASLQILKAKLDAASAYVFIIPEYNNSIPGVFKLFLDALPYQKMFDGKMAALVGVAAGAQGGATALSHATDILHYMGLNVLPSKPKLALIRQYFNDIDGITNDLYLDAINLQAKHLKSWLGQTLANTETHN